MNTIYHKIAALALSLICCVSLSAQESKSSETKYQVSINPVGTMLGLPQVGLEHALPAGFSLGGHVGPCWGKDPFGWGDVFAKAYFKGEAFKGLYVKGKVQYANCSEPAYNMLGGLAIGRQTSMSDNWNLDISVGVRGSRKLIDHMKDLPDYDFEFLRLYVGPFSMLDISIAICYNRPRRRS